MLSPDYSFIENLIRLRLPNVKIDNIKPFQKFYKRTSDFIYDSGVLYFGLFNLNDKSSLALSLNNTIHFETIIFNGITSSFLFDRLNARDSLFIGFKVIATTSDIIISPAEFNSDFSSDFFI